MGASDHKGGPAPSSSAGGADPAPLKAASAHGPGACSVAWCQIDDGGSLAWAAVSTGQDGKLVMRRADEDLGMIRASGDHGKASPCVVVSNDGALVASMEGAYVQVCAAPPLRCWGC